MNRNRCLKLGGVVTVVVLVAVLVVAWRSVGAQQGDGPGGGLGGSGSPGGEAAAPQAPVPGGPGFCMQSALAFRPYVATAGWAYTGGDLYNPEASDHYYYASLPLPNGGTIARMVAYFYDACTSDLGVRLFRLGGSGEIDEMAAVASSGAVMGYRNAIDTTIIYPVVDQQSYSYVAEVRLSGGCGSSLRLTNVRVDYAYTASLPLVTKD